jgi:hypothetical protein
MILLGMSEKCHEQTSSALFDHLVGGRQQRWRHIAPTNRSRLDTALLIGVLAKIGFSPKERGRMNLLIVWSKQLT